MPIRKRMTAVDDRGFAPAKINLTLHLEGQRPDGYHLLRSLVVFVGVGDRVRLDADNPGSLRIDGPFAAGLRSDDNLITRAASALAKHHNKTLDCGFHLVKRLPVASGIGGGSSDAAAALRLAARRWGVDVPQDLALSLGADVPVCLQAPSPCLMSGIGDVLQSVSKLPDCWLVLVNPGVEVPTSTVFAGVRDRNPPPGAELPVAGFGSFDRFREWLSAQRNDLQAPAEAICPEIGAVLDRLAGAPLSRMSGSGATCFGLFPDQATAVEMANAVAKDTDWWVSVAPVLRPSA